MSLTQAIDDLLASFDGSLIPAEGAMRDRFDSADRAVWVEACKLGCEDKLPQADRKRGHLGKTNLPCIGMVDGSVYRTSVRTWTNDLLALRALAEVKQGIESAAVPDDQSEEQPKPEVVWLGKDKVRIGDRSLSLEPQLAAVLGALVEAPSATTPELQKLSGYSEVARLLKKLTKKFPDLSRHIHFPGSRGRGGYSTTIRAE